MTSLTQVQALANAYRDAMRAGDAELAHEPVERRLLNALVASSAADTARWIKTRLPEGDAAAAPLDALVPSLEETDVVGKSLDWVSKQLRNQAKAAVKSLVFAGTVPVWLSAALALVVGVLGFTFDAGVSAGHTVAALFLGGGSLAFGAWRGITVAGPRVVDAVSGAAGSLWSRVGNLGAHAERVYDTAVTPALSSVYGGTPYSTGPSVTTQVRTSAQGIVGTAYAALAIASLVFAAGMLSAVHATFSTPPLLCQYVPSDPSCRTPG